MSSGAPGSWQTYEIERLRIGRARREKLGGARGERRVGAAEREAGRASL